MKSAVFDPVQKQLEIENTPNREIRASMERQLSFNQRQQKRLARKIHDEISQKMTLLSLQLSMAATDGQPPADWAVTCQKWADLIMELGQSIREITAELQPRIVDNHGLKPALRWLVQTSAKNISCSLLEPHEEISLPPFAALELFSLCREVVTDLLIPGGAKRVELELEQKEGVVLLHLRIRQQTGEKKLITHEALDSAGMSGRLTPLDGAVELDESDAGLVLTLSLPAEHLVAELH